MNNMIFQMFVVSLGATIGLEILVLLMLGEQSKKNIFLLVMVNILTNPQAVYLAYLGKTIFSVHELLIEVPIEIGVVLLEVAIYIWFSKDENWKIKRPILLGILANIFSWTIGILL